MTDITAELHNVSWSKLHPKSLIGSIKNDSRGRWRDGTPITTSTVVKDLGNNVFKTLNSTYKVVNWNEDRTEENHQGKA